MSKRGLFTILSSAALLTACATAQENPNYKYSTKYKAGVPTTMVASTGISTAPVGYQAVSNAPVAYESSQQASYTRVNQACLKKEKNRELLGAGIGGTVGAIVGKKVIGGTEGTVIGAGLGGAAGYGIGDKTIDCDPVTVAMPLPQSAPVVSAAYVSPTDTQFATISDQGTPGYQVIQAQTVEMYDTPASVSGAAGQEVSYDYSENVISADAATMPEYSETRLMSGGAISGHTVKQGDTVYSLSRRLCVGIDEIQSLNGLDANFGINIGDRLSLPASRC